MKTLHKITEIKSYCGPAAIMSITGMRLPEVRAAINSCRGMRENQGVMRITARLLEQSMQKLNIEYIKHTCPVKTNLLTLNLKELKPDVRYIVNITNHFVTMQNGLLIDNHYRFGTDVDDCRWMRKNVKAYYE